MSKISYSLDTIKSNWVLMLVLLFISFSSFTLLIVFQLKVFWPILPSFLVRSISAPILNAILFSVIFIKNKKRLFWSKMDITIDEQQATLTINNRCFSFINLEYYEYRPGSFLTTGGGILVLFLKFKGEKEQMIMPCKSSKEIQNYDNFILNFDTILMNLELDQKKKSLPKTTRVILIIICFTLPLLFIGLWIGKGFENAIKVLPSIFVFYGICMVHLLKRKKAN